MWDEDAPARPDWRVHVAPGLAAAATAGLAFAVLPVLSPWTLPFLQEGQIFEPTAAVAGFSLAAALLPWTALSLWRLGRESAWRIFIMLMLLFMVAATVESGALAVQRIAADLASGRAALDAREMATALADSDTAMAMVARRQGDTVMLHSDAGGAAGALHDAIRRMIGAVGAAENAQGLQFKAAGNAPLLGARTFAASGGLAAARARIARYRAIDTAYDAAIAKALADYRAFLARGVPEAKDRTKALAVFDAHARDERAFRRPRATARKAYFDAYDAALRDLERAHAPWHAKDDGILFEDLRDHVAFSADLAEVRRATRALHDIADTK